MQASPDETLVSLFLAQAKRSAIRVAFRTKRFGIWQTTTWAEWERRARLVAAELLRLGVQAGDRVAILANTREEWVIADTAALLVGAVTVPIYHSLAGDQVEFILENSGARVAFVEDVATMARVASQTDILTRLVRVILLDDVRRPDTSDKSLPTNVGFFSELLAKDLSESLSVTIDERMHAVAPSGLATIMYTSGTTGPPKGVMLTHANFAFETRAISKVVELTEMDEQLLLLPLAHIFGKLLIAMQLRAGYSTAFAESLIKALDNAVEVNPTFMGCVPRLYEKIYTVASSRAAEQGAVKKSIFEWASEVSRRAAQIRATGAELDLVLSIQHHYAYKLVLSKVRFSFGRKLRLAISGGAPLSRELAEWFSGAGVSIYEAYGLTEVTGGSTLNTPSAYRFGSVGQALPEVGVRIAEDGEVLLRGPNLMRGYWRNEAATAEAIDSDGWFHSGDIGREDRNRFLEITDRKKDIIVTAGGKNIAPQNLENMLKQCSWVSQALVYGDKKPYLVALIALNPEAIARYNAETGRSVALPGCASDSDVRARVEAEIEVLNARLSKFETIKKFAILPEDPSVQGGDLTPTMKLRRKVLTERYRGTLEALYG